MTLVSTISVFALYRIHCNSLQNQQLILCSLGQNKWLLIDWRSRSLLGGDFRSWGWLLRTDGGYSLGFYRYRWKQEQTRADLISKKKLVYTTQGGWIGLGIKPFQSLFQCMRLCGSFWPSSNDILCSYKRCKFWQHFGSHESLWQIILHLFLKLQHDKLHEWIVYSLWPFAILERWKHCRTFWAGQSIADFPESLHSGHAIHSHNPEKNPGHLFKATFDYDLLCYTSSLWNGLCESSSCWKVLSDIFNFWNAFC